MAKGNPFMGTIKGRIGDNVLYVSKGEQNIIKYQKNVTNPRSNGQMYQRARFSNAGRFFTRGRKAFFKFAFENKKGAQSDFNAFMAANINRTCLISKSALQVEGYPAIGKFIMCQGSLASVTNRVVNDYWQAHFGIPAQSVNPTTIGELSQLLINTNSYQQGDILTFVFLNTSSSGLIPEVHPQGNYSTDWTIKQFRVNVADSSTLESYEMRATTRVWDGRSLMTLTDLADSQMLNSAYGGFVCVHSRNTAGNLKVSTQELAVGASMQEAIDIAMTDEYIQQVIEDWKSTDQVQIAPDAVLKGSLSYQKSLYPSITLMANPDAPYLLRGAYFYGTEPMSIDSNIIVGYLHGDNLTDTMFNSFKLSGDGDADLEFERITSGEHAGDIAIRLVTERLIDGRYSFRIRMIYGSLDVPVAGVVAYFGSQLEDFVLATPSPADEYFPCSVNGSLGTLDEAIAPLYQSAQFWLYVPAGVTEEQLSVRKVSGSVTDDFVGVIDQEEYMSIFIQGDNQNIGNFGENVFEVLYNNQVVATIIFTCTGVPMMKPYVQEIEVQSYSGTTKLSGVISGSAPWNFVSNVIGEDAGGPYRNIVPQGPMNYLRLSTTPGFDVSKLTIDSSYPIEQIYPQILQDGGDTFLAIEANRAGTYNFNVKYNNLVVINATITLYESMV